MSKPILEPGRPGDLLMIAENFWAELQEIQKRDPDNVARVRGVAIATTEALGMWLGVVPVPEDDDG